MTHTKISRLKFLQLCGLGAATFPASWCKASEIDPKTKLKLRFAIASDIHYGQNKTPYEKYANELVTWLNAEKDKQLDAIFLNGDLVQDSAPALLELRDKYLSKLKTPYYCNKGNHDFLDPKPNSPASSWDKVWGYPSNHAFQTGDFAFILANTSAAHQANVYLAADYDWLRMQLEKYSKSAGIFVFIHIAQRKGSVQGWPAHGVYKAEEVKKGEAVMTLLESTPNVRAVFHGHNHKQTGQIISGELRYFFDSHIGGSWGATRGYRIVEIYEGNRILSYQWNAENMKVANKNTITA